MAFPTVSAPYGLKPINLIGGQVFAGSTRQIPIQYGYATNIYYGDFVNISLNGTVTRMTVTTGAGSTTGGAGYGMVGIFLGCSYTNPTTKQKLFSQYWPGGTLAGDAFAVVTDDPDTVFRTAVVSSQGGTTIASASTAFIGQNLSVSNLAGSTATGNSKNAALTSVSRAKSITRKGIAVLEALGNDADVNAAFLELPVAVEPAKLETDKF